MLSFCKENLDALTGSILNGIHNVEEYLASLEQAAQDVAEQASSDGSAYSDQDYGYMQGFSFHEGHASMPVTEPPTTYVEETYYEEQHQKKVLHMKK